MYGCVFPFSPLASSLSLPSRSRLPLIPFSNFHISSSPHPFLYLPFSPPVSSRLIPSHPVSSRLIPVSTIQLPPPVPSLSLTSPFTPSLHPFLCLPLLTFPPCFYHSSSHHLPHPFLCLPLLTLPSSISLPSHIHPPLIRLSAFPFSPSHRPFLYLHFSPSLPSPTISLDPFLYLSLLTHSSACLYLLPTPISPLYLPPPF